MIAYFVLVHRYPEQFKRLFKAIYEPGNCYVVHIDKSSGEALADDIAEFLTPYQGVKILPAQNALWGGYSLVDAELRGMEMLLEMNERWSHYINLSGQDFPLKSQRYIRDFLKAHPGKQFIRSIDQAACRPETMNRLNSYFIEALGEIVPTEIPRPFFSDAKPYIGTQWKVVTRSFCQYVCHDPGAERYKDFYRNSFIADEGFFQTVMMNHGGMGEVMNDDLRMIDWVPDGDIKLRPRNFGVADFPKLARSPDLFARKFDSQEDPAILSLLEDHLHSDAAQIYREPAEHPLFVTRRPEALPTAA
jgi:Core-2/I-Branching enzyme